MKDNSSKDFNETAAQQPGKDVDFTPFEKFRIEQDARRMSASPSFSGKPLFGLKLSAR